MTTNERPTTMNDSDRNIMRSLAHEACEAHCADCGACIFTEPDPTEAPLCEDCRYGAPNVKHPEIEVELIGHDGNAFAILGATMRAMRKAGLKADEIAEYQTEAMAGDYDALLATTMRWVEVS